MLATYNEAANIDFVLDEVAQAATRLARRGVTLAVLLVDDASPDRTADLAATAAAQHGLRLRLVTGRKEGLGAAYVRGLRAATDAAPGPLGDSRPADFIVALDADRQHDARQIPSLVEAFLTTGAGVLIGSRWTRGGHSPGTGPVRTALSRAGNLAFRAVTGTRGVRDATTSFRVIDPAVAVAFDASGLRVSGYAFFSSFVAVAQASGALVAESPITFRPRGGGQSKLTAGDGIEFFRNLLTIRRTVRRISAERAGRRRSDHPAPVPAPWAARQGSAWAASFGASAELAHLGMARRFVRWVVDELDAGLGDPAGDGGAERILHVGAGIGTFTRELHRRRPGADLLAIEAAPGPARSLATAAREHGFEARRTDAAELLAERELAGAPGFDAVVVTNVLEQLADDVDGLRTLAHLVRPGGRLAVVASAGPAAYGTMDHLAGHHRRYSAETLRSAMEGAGLEVELVRPIDALGLVIYRLAYRVLRISSLRRPQVLAYDSLLVPLSRARERHGRPPLQGKNLVAVARRPDRPAIT
jgi:dolichol-phosphate mannosyltransferase